MSTVSGPCMPPLGLPVTATGRSGAADATLVAKEKEQAAQGAAAPQTAALLEITGGLDLEAFMMMIQAKRASNLESQMANQVKAMQDRQTQIGELSELLNSVRTSCAGTADDKTVALRTETVTALAKFGITTTNPLDKKARDGLLENTKGKLETLNSSSQMDMIHLQSVSNKRNEAFEQMTNIIQKFAKSRDSIIGNMR